MRVAEPIEEGESVRSGHLGVEQQEIRLKLGDERQDAVRLVADAGHLDVRVRLQECAHRHGHEDVVVGDDDAHGICPPGAAFRTHGY